ncbi:MAG: FHA domain-containing protein [Aggregatilineales bacterium]
MRQTVSITFMSGPLDGKTLSWEVPNDGSDLTIVIGRRPNLHVTISYDQQVSRTHAHLIYVPSTDQFFLVDKKSRNHTFLSMRREKLEPEQRYEIAPGTLFQVGRTWLRLDGDGTTSGAETFEEE